ncbi:MAG: 2-oxoacid:acceptor oxidoreductase subunit alpha [Rhodospirillaceae bacterium]|nr:2-oxoacid:acceptor oxidoreductase subunit alpha [Rhodospirillaceae bacterium]
MDGGSAAPDESGNELESAVVRFAGDSGDGMQLTGTQFTQATAMARNDLATFPDFPAEIRAPAGTTFGVSAFQIHFGSRTIRTSGDAVDVLVAMNPAALKTNLDDLRKGGLIIVDTGSFSRRNLNKAGFEENPLEDGTLDGYRKLEVDMTRMTVEAVKPFGLGNKDAQRCKNMWALGLVDWLFGRDRTINEDWLKQKFARKPAIADANIAALNAGHAFGETADMAREFGSFVVPPADIQPGTYRALTGAEGVAMGLVAGARLAGLHLLFTGYPITPASALLHLLAPLKDYGVTTFQAEDEIAAVCAAIGGSYAGALGVTSSSGPGIALKTEAIGLAIATELPLVVVNSQRGGPSTGLPTKTEQSDLYQAIYGRNADSPLAVVACHSPGDAYFAAIEACRLAVKYMTPVMFLTDGYISNAAEPWLIPDFEDHEPFPVTFRTDPEGYQVYARDPETMARAWVKPGTPGLLHRIGGIEKHHLTGDISYDADNHQEMTDNRLNKILGIAKDIPAQAVDQGQAGGRVAVVGWGSTYGPISRAVSNKRAQGHDVSHIHIRHIRPMPPNLGDLLKSYDAVIVPEMNTGQLVTVLRAEYLVDAKPLNKVNGKPFRIVEIEDALKAWL